MEEVLLLQAGHARQGRRRVVVDVAMETARVPLGLAPPTRRVPTFFVAAPLLPATPSATITDDGPKVTRAALRPLIAEQVAYIREPVIQAIRQLRRQLDKARRKRPAIRDGGEFALVRRVEEQMFGLAQALIVAVLLTLRVEIAGR